MKLFPLFFLFTFSLFSCGMKDSGKKLIKDNYTERIELMNTDREFSEVCEEKGFKAAFVEYIDSNGVLLRPDHLPIVGADAIDYLIQMDDTDFTLEWQPHYVEVAQSADLGFTYGVYALTPISQDTTLYGTYVSIWKKCKDGNWKFVLESTNDGLGAH